MFVCTRIPSIYLSLTPEDLDLLENDFPQFIIKYPEHIVLDMCKTEDGSYELEQVGVC